MGQIEQLRKGSTSLLILKLLEEKPMYGYQIMQEMESRSEGYFSMTAALLYPTLHQLENDGLLKSEWTQSEAKRRRKYYAITENGRKALQEDTALWQEFVHRLFKTLRKPLPGKEDFS